MLFIDTFAILTAYFCNMKSVKRIKNGNPFNWKTALLFSITITIVLNALVLIAIVEGMRITNLDVNMVLVKFGARLVVNVITLFLLYMFAFRAIQSKQKTFVKCIVTIFGTIFLASILSAIFFSVSPSSKFNELSGLLILCRWIGDVFVAILVLLSTSQLHVMYLRQQTLVENEKLIAENIRNRYEALKNQVDPHFLFNSLNTLNGLIGYDDDRAHKYVEKLSSVFRYTIQNKEIITLQGELDFTESYAYLMKIRYGENFSIEYNIDEKYFSYYIMPISVQLQIENAVKHNVISNKYPLCIKISTTDSDTLAIENTIQAKTLPVHGTGIGLANLAERYKLLLNKEITINNTNNIFRVEIPLISPEKEIKRT